MMFWQKVGIEAARLIATMLLTVGVIALGWRKYLAPEFIEALEEASKVTKQIASLGGIKKADYEDVTRIENKIGAQIIASKMPELEGIKLLLGAETAADLDAFIENNPTAAMQLYEKYKHFLPGSQASEQTTDF